MEENRPTAPCKLCGNTALLCQSHIIPRRHLRSILRNPAKKALVLGSINERQETVQDGPKEHLLCKACEKFLNDRLEKPFEKLWFDRPALPQTLARSFELQGIDYTKFKLLLLSILWRASVSSLKQFREVRLGPYEEKIRRMILDEYPGPEYVFPIVGLISVDDTGSVFDNACFSPIRGKTDSSHIYCFPFVGVDWFFVISEHRSSFVEGLIPHALREAGSMLFGVRRYQESVSLNSFLDGASQSRVSWLLTNS